MSDHNKVSPTSLSQKISDLMLNVGEVKRVASAVFKTECQAQFNQRAVFRGNGTMIQTTATTNTSSRHETDIGKILRRSDVTPFCKNAFSEGFEYSNKDLWFGFPALSGSWYHDSSVPTLLLSQMGEEPFESIEMDLQTQLNKSRRTAPITVEEATTNLAPVDGIGHKDSHQDWIDFVTPSEEICGAREEEHIASNLQSKTTPGPEIVLIQHGSQFEDHSGAEFASFLAEDIGTARNGTVEMGPFSTVRNADVQEDVAISRSRNVTPAELSSVVSVSRTEHEENTSFAASGHKGPILSIELLKDVDARAREGSVVPLRCLDSSARDELTFFLEVKNKVEQIKKAQSSALERQEEAFDRGAVMSMSDDSQGSDGSSVSSLESNAAVVAGRIDPHKAVGALKRKLQLEGRSEAQIEYELKCHMTPSEIQQEHRRRRRISNRLIAKRRKELEKRRPPRQRHASPSSQIHSTISFDEHHSPILGLVLGTDSPASPPPTDVELHETPLAVSIELQHQVESTTPLSFSEVRERNQSPHVEVIRSDNDPKNWAFVHFENSISDTASPDAIAERQSSEGKIYTRDERKLAQRRQKSITSLFVSLQKKCHRGSISEREFEAQKQEMFQSIFGCDENGKIFVKESTSEGIKKTRQRVRSCERELVRKRGRRAFRMPGWFNADDTDAALEEDDIEIKDCCSEDEAEASSVVENGSWVRIKQEDDYKSSAKKKALSSSRGSQLSRSFGRSSKKIEEFANLIFSDSRIRRETKKLREKQERRQMLMRMFDQRAPPSDRMFHQDTSLHSDGRPTAEQKENWLLWNTPARQRPNWMTCGEGSKHPLWEK